VDRPPFRVRYPSWVSANGGFFVQDEVLTELVFQLSRIADALEKQEVSGIVSERTGGKGSDLPVVSATPVDGGGYHWDIPEDAGKGYCRDCNGRVYWILSPGGKKIMLNGDGTSHFSSCPVKNAAKELDTDPAEPPPEFKSRHATEQEPKFDTEVPF